MCIAVDACAEAIGITFESGLNTAKKGLKCYRKGSQYWAHFPDENDARKKWIVVDSLPSMTRERVECYYGNLAKYFYKESFHAAVEKTWISADISYFIDRKMTTDQATKMAASAAWLRWLAADDNPQPFETLQARYEMIVSVLQDTPGHTLRVSNWRSLRNKVVAWRQEGVASLISKKVGNENSRKITDEGRSFIIHTYGSPLKPTFRDVHRLYMTYAQDQGWKPIDEERVRQILQEPDVVQIVALSRHGVAQTRNMFERTIKRRKPSFADALWTLDGFTVQLRYQVNGKIESGIYCVGIMDVYSDKIVGYAAGTVESATLVQKALRDAIRTTMMTPAQLQYDNSSANKSFESTELFKRIARYAFPTAPYNGKAKPIESLIGRLEGRNMRHMANFKGGNITSPSLNIKANPDFLASLELPDLRTAIGQLELLIKVHNNTTGQDGRTPNERYQDHHDSRKVMDYISMVEAFWVTRREPARYDKDGITIQVDHQRYTYEVQGPDGLEDMAFRMEWLGTRFTVKYDPDDLEYICLYYEDKMVGTARQKYEAPMAIVDITDDDTIKIKRSIRSRKDYLQNLESEMEEHRMQVVKNDLPDELSHALLHKDAYNRLEQSILDGQIDQAALNYAGYKKKPTRGGLYEPTDDEDIKPIFD